MSSEEDKNAAAAEVTQASTAEGAEVETEQGSNVPTEEPPAAAPAAAAAPQIKPDFEKDASKYPIETLLEWKEQQNQPSSDFHKLDFRKLNENDLDKLFPLHGDLHPPKGMRTSAKKIAEWRVMSKEQQNKVLHPKKKQMEKNAKKYTLEALLEMKKKRRAAFDRLDFRGLDPADLDKLFPTHGDVRPPKEMRSSAKKIAQWRRMSRKEQLSFEGSKPQPYAGGDLDVGRGINPNTKHPVLQELLQAPMCPPLSHPIPYLEEKKRLVDIRLFYREIPSDFGEEDWKIAANIQKAFRPKKDFGGLQPPQALLLDAKTPQDKLTIINWWQFLSNEQQKREIELLKNTYSHPRSSNRLLPADFFAKIAAYEQRYEERTKPKPAPADGGAQNEFYVRWPKSKKPKELEDKRDSSCRGWSGERYDELFRQCYFETLKDLTMEGGAKVLDSFPIPKSVSQAKLARDLVFVREGDNYVLRSVRCTNQRMVDKPGRFCEACHGLSATVGHIKQDHIRRGKREVEKTAKQQEKVKLLKRNLRSALNREKRLKNRAEDRKDAAAAAAAAGDPLDHHHEPPQKKQRAQGSPKRLPMVQQQNQHGFVHRAGPPPAVPIAYGALPQQQQQQQQQHRPHPHLRAPFE